MVLGDFVCWSKRGFWMSLREVKEFTVPTIYKWVIIWITSENRLGTNWISIWERQLSLKCKVGAVCKIINNRNKKNSEWLGP